MKFLPHARTNYTSHDESFTRDDRPTRRRRGGKRVADARRFEEFEMSRIEKSIDVDVPVATAYNQWTQFEEFPRFMQGVKTVRQLDPRTLEWSAEIGGKTVTWTAVITHQEPDRRIGWRSATGAANAGMVTFMRLDENATRITLEIEYEPHGMVETTGSALGLVGTRIQADLERFKGFLEVRGRETGAWRGEIHGGEVLGRDGKADGAQR